MSRGTTGSLHAWGLGGHASGTIDCVKGGWTSAARARRWPNERENRESDSAYAGARFLPFSLPRRRERERERGLEERTRYTPARYPSSGRRRAPLTALRPIGELRRGRKDAIAKRCRLASPLPAPRCPEPPSRGLIASFRAARRRSASIQSRLFQLRSREPPGNPSHTSPLARSAARFAAASRSTTMIGRALSRSAAAVSDRPARAALTRHTLHNSSRATSPSKTARKRLRSDGHNAIVTRFQRTMHLTNALPTVAQPAPVISRGSAPVSKRARSSNDDKPFDSDKGLDRANDKFAFAPFLLIALLSDNPNVFNMHRFQVRKRENFSLMASLNFSFFF